MAKHRSLALLAIHLKPSDKSHVPSMVKLGECFLKYSFLAAFTRLVSQLNASEWLCLSALYQGGTSCCLQLGGPSVVALDVVLPRGMPSSGSGEGSHLLGLGLGESSGTSAGEAVEADGCLEKPIMIRRMGEMWVPPHQYVIGGYQCASEFPRASI